MVESDSLLIINMINNKAKAPWLIQHAIDQIVLLSSSVILYLSTHTEWERRYELANMGKD